MHRVKRLATAAIVTLITPAVAGSPYPGLNIDTLEIVNDGGSALAPICTVLVYDPGHPNLLKGECIITFARKRTWDWHLLMAGPASTFHLVHPIGGHPVPVEVIWDDGHHTTTSGLLGMWIRKNLGLQGGDVTMLIAGDLVYIDARQP
jgi:hypothetical protein